MNQNDLLQWATVTLIVLIAGIAASFRWRARTGEAISRAEEGLVFAIALRLAGLGLWISLLGGLMFPDAWRWARLPIPMPARWAALAVGALAVPLMVWTLSSLGRNLTDTVVTRAQATLVTNGPYHYVRHPFYFTAGLLVAAVAMASANGALAACGIVVLTMLAIRTTTEEKKLIERFGDDYRHYMARTRKFLPFVWR